MADQSKQSARETMMMTEPVSKIIPKMALPTIVAFVITSIYSLADTYFVSSLGTNATAAVSVNTSLDNLIFMFASLFALGANSYIARLLGARDKDGANRVLSTSWWIAAGFGVFVMIVGKLLVEPMVTLMGATDTCRQYSIDYANYLLYAAPFVCTNVVMNQCLRSEGSAMRSMAGMAVGGIINCFLDPIFILDELHIGSMVIPCLGMQVMGASLATAISKGISFIVLLYPYVTRKAMLSLSPKNFHPTFRILKEVISIGLPGTLRSFLAIVSGIFLNRLAGGISDSVLAGIGVTTKIMMFPFGIILGFGSGYQPVAGFNWGARRFDRVEESYRFAAKTAVIGATVMAVLLGAFAPQVIGLFSTTDPEMVAVGTLCIRLQCITMPIHAWVALINMLCAGLGYAFYAFILAIARQGTCFLTILFPLYWLFGTTGVCAVQATADLLTLCFAVPIFLRILKTVKDAQNGILPERLVDKQ